MPVDAKDSVTKEVLYPDDLTGETLEIDPNGLMNGAVQFWDAEEEATPDGAKYGLFCPVDSAEHGEVWASAPRELREAMVDLVPGDIIEVLSCEQGEGDPAPWYVDIAVLTEG